MDFKKINILPPFKQMVATVGELPSSFLESMTYYECLCYFYNYLANTINPAITNDQEAIIELQEAMTNLKNYVDNYFNNLDLQDEVNKKLDEMVTDGTLAKLINEDLLGEINTKLNRLETKVKSVETTANTANTTANEAKNLADTNSTSIGELRTDVNKNTTDIGLLTNLETTDKENLVGAINEVKNSSGGFLHISESGTLLTATNMTDLFLVSEQLNNATLDNVMIIGGSIKLEYPNSDTSNKVSLITTKSSLCSICEFELGNETEARNHIHVLLTRPDELAGQTINYKVDLIYKILNN